MKSLKYIILFFVLFSMIGLSEVYSQGNAVIVNKANPNDELSSVAVKLYYLRKVTKRWPELNKNINPVESQIASQKNQFCSNVLKMSSSEVQRHFVERQYQKAEPVPVQANSDADVIKYVDSYPGAIGYVKLSSLSASDLDKVKVVLEF